MSISNDLDSLKFNLGQKVDETRIMFHPSKLINYIYPEMLDKKINIVINVEDREGKSKSKNFNTSIRELYFSTDLALSPLYYNLLHYIKIISSDIDKYLEYEENEYELKILVQNKVRQENPGLEEEDGGLFHHKFNNYIRDMAHLEELYKEIQNK